MPILQLFRSPHRHQTMILALAVRELQSRYVGTLGRILWIFAHPLAVIAVFYFVFAVGFKSQVPPIVFSLLGTKVLAT